MLRKLSRYVDIDVYFGYYYYNDCCCCCYYTVSAVWKDRKQVKSLCMSMETAETLCRALLWAVTLIVGNRNLLFYGLTVSLFLTSYPHVLIYLGIRQQYGGINSLYLCQGLCVWTSVTESGQNLQNQLTIKHSPPIAFFRFFSFRLQAQCHASSPSPEGL